uniref:Putative secreted salivary protein n=1 Tax=Ixodes scapularis TaxID=6945 RepID=Q4PMM6_IXOSC|nr:putative secreted salivary protein [Ixodes scapularis]
MRSAILIATFFIVGMVSTDATVIFDLTKCVKEFVTDLAKKSHREIVSLNLSAAASFSQIIHEHKTPLRIEVRNIIYGRKAQSKISEKSTNYSTYFTNKDYTKPQQRHYRGDVPRRIVAIWKLKRVFQSEFSLGIATKPPKAYTGSEEQEYRFDLNDTLMLERVGSTHLIRNKTFTVQPRKTTKVTLTVREETKIRSFRASIVLKGYFGVKIRPRGDEPSSWIFCITQVPCEHLKKTGDDEMTFQVKGTFEEIYPVSKITLTTHDLMESEEEIEVPPIHLFKG